MWDTQNFKRRRVLLLQGPVGPFFARLARDLRTMQAEVFKVNFNAGDALFYPRHATAYRGAMEDWPSWLENHMRALRIDVVLLYGDCRPIHQAAQQVAKRCGVEVGVFEEGYIRPDYVTLERSGVNANSLLPRDADFFYGADIPDIPPTRPVGRAYWPMVWWGMWYFMVGALGRPLFPRYQHHRPLSVLESLVWVRSAWRKLWYGWKERHVQAELVAQAQTTPYYLVPLQVFNDAQVTVHSNFQNVDGFIASVMHSFAAKAPVQAQLVIKHHPMDRGYRDYTQLIGTLAQETGLGARVHYIHDQHLPTLLDHARGVVVINSTVGLSALHHGTATMACGTAIYDLPGLTWQGTLDDFWQAAQDARPDPVLYRNYRAYLIATTQLNGSFYKPLAMPLTTVLGGIVWRKAPRSTAARTPSRSRAAHRQARPVEPPVPALRQALVPIAVKPAANHEHRERAVHDV